MISRFLKSNGLKNIADFIPVRFRKRLLFDPDLINYLCFLSSFEVPNRVIDFLRFRSPILHHIILDSFSSILHEVDRFRSCLLTYVISSYYVSLWFFCLSDEAQGFYTILIEGCPPKTDLTRINIKFCGYFG